MRLAIVLAALLRVGGASTAAGQVAVELRAGGAAGAYESTGAGFQTLPRPAFALSASYSPLPQLAIYAGYARASFGCNQGFCRDVDPTFTTSGPRLGIEAAFPRYFLLGRLGLVRHSLVATSTVDGSARERSSDPAIGIEAGVSGLIPAAPRLSVTPGVSMIRYSAVMPEEPTAGVAIFTLDLGLRYGF